MNTLELEVEGMNCQHCVQSVRKALEGVAGVASATVSLEAKRASVALFDGAGAPAPDALIQAVEQAGFTARAAAADAEQKKKS